MHEKIIDEHIYLFYACKIIPQYRRIGWNNRLRWILILFFFFCSMFPKSTHETFAQKMYQTYKSHKRFSKPKLARTDFTINHYAGDVSEKVLDFFLGHSPRIRINRHKTLLMHRSHIKRIIFLIKTKIMLLQSIKLFYVLPSAHLLLIFSLLYQRRRQSNPNSLPLVHSLR